MLENFPTFSVSAALTAPLPYTGSKARKGAASRQADLPRAVLFDMTNDATPQETKTPDSPRDRDIQDLTNDATSQEADAKAPDSPWDGDHNQAEGEGETDEPSLGQGGPEEGSGLKEQVQLACFQRHNTSQLNLAELVKRGWGGGGVVQ